MVGDLTALGLDFLQYLNLVMNFCEETVQVYKGTQLLVEHQQLKQMMNDSQNSKPHVGVIAADSSVMPDFCAPNTYKLPESWSGDFRQLVEELKTLYQERLHLTVTTFQQRVHSFVYLRNTFQAIIIRKLLDRLSCC